LWKKKQQLQQQVLFQYKVLSIVYTICLKTKPKPCLPD
jgi:hypothetical protein